jgi:hypothetical protein
MARFFANFLKSIDMTRKIKLFIALLAATMGTAPVAHAAFPIKEATAAVAEAPAAIVEPQELNASIAALTAAESTQTLGTEVKAVKKESFVARMWHKVTAKAAAVIHPFLYVVLCILPLGWLAIGINDDWHGNDWWIALLLYFIFYIPGVIFSLIKMGKYY